ncbi:DUF58 domain-containing protein [Luminiphilus sp.]|nr:DUF58 domain-containing protein [Luminiphilus sp.]
MTNFLPKGHRILAERLIEGRHIAQQININAQSKALALLAGRRRIRQRGRGVDFEEVRLYAAGDDVRTIDWRVTARSGEPHTKLFQEDREQPIVLLVDLRSAMWFGSKNCFKSVLASHIASVLAWAGLDAGERVGGIAMTNSGLFEIKPQRSKRSVLRLLRLFESALGPDNDDLPGDLSATIWPTALAQLKNLSRPGARLMIISDFDDFSSDDGVEKRLRDVVGHRQVVCFRITDPLDAELPPAGRYALSASSGQVKIDTSNARLREHYQADFAASQQQVSEYLKRYQVPVVTVDTKDNPNELLQRVFPKR